MSIRNCILMGVMAALLGLALRLSVPVTPPDEAFREVLRFHRSLG